MGENTSIEWAHHTFNPWSGCAKVSAGCAHCYAASLPPSMRRGAEWGEGRDRVPASDAYWRQPIAWNRAAQKAGERHRVFCASTADFFEDREDLHDARMRLFMLIEETPHLDWLLLTKRPHVARRYRDIFRSMPNAWIGASVEDQEAADARIPILLQIPARVRFLSMEPLLGPVDIRAHLPRFDHCPEERAFEAMPESQRALGDETGCQGCPGNGRGECAAVMTRGLDWVIVGGESGRRARPMHPDWARSVRDQCVAAGVPFFLKQFGEWRPMARQAQPVCPASGNAASGHYVSYPSHDFGDTIVELVGKKLAGRLLDGRTWDEVPR